MNKEPTPSNNDKALTLRDVLDRARQRVEAEAERLRECERQADANKGE